MKTCSDIVIKYGPFFGPFFLGPFYREKAAEPFHLHAIYFVTIASVRYSHIKIKIRMSHVREGALLLIHYYAYNEKRILHGRMEIRVTLS